MITMLTEIYRDHIHYSVQRDDDVLWHQKVHFAHDAAHRAGGYAFQSASREQQQQANIARHSDEPIEERLHNFARDQR